MKRVGIIGASGYVGQRFVSLLQEHPFFQIEKIAASSRSAGHSYREVIEGRRVPNLPSLNADVLNLTMQDLTDLDQFCEGLDLVFCAVNMPKAEINELEAQIAKREVVVVSNNSAGRLVEDIPMIIPEINAAHLEIATVQKKRLGTRKGFVVCKPNCSIQSYVPALTALRGFGPKTVFVSTYQAISGAGKTFESMPEIVGNLIPFISGEEQKSEEEPLKIWGHIEGDHVKKAQVPLISAQCYRVPVQEGHTAAVSVAFEKKPSQAAILEAFDRFNENLLTQGLPSAPQKFIHYYEEEQRPQPALDALKDKGMAIHIGRLREDPILDYKFCCLTHNTLRGAAGGAVLTAELLHQQGYLD